MRQLFAGVVLAAMACGGGEAADSEGAASESAAPAEAPAAAAAEAGEVHEVLMQEIDGQMVYTPSTLTIKAGDTVRWINRSGGPHNVAFYADQVPESAVDVLNAAMANRLSDLNGGLVVEPEATYTIDFTGAPVGDYGYYCMPHEVVGMVASLTVVE